MIDGRGEVRWRERKEKFGVISIEVMIYRRNDGIGWKGRKRERRGMANV